jgi:hypothetical protein
MLSIGLLSGGYGEDELVRAGAFRVFRDAADLHGYLDELTSVRFNVNEGQYSMDEMGLRRFS